MHPRDQTSALKLYPESCISSGDIYRGVPTFEYAYNV